MLEAIKQLDEHLKFAAEDGVLVGCVQLNVGLPLTETEGANSEKLRNELRRQLIDFLYGEMKEDLTAMRNILVRHPGISKSATIQDINNILQKIEE